MLKYSPLPLLLAGLISLGCSCNASTSSPQTQQKAAQALVNGITGNARGARNQARVLRAESDKCLAAKDYNGAMDKRLAMFIVRGKDASIFGVVTSYAIQSLALGELSSVASHLDAPSCRKYAAQLKALDAQMPTYSSVLQKRKVSELKSIALYTSKPKEWNEAIARLGLTPQERQTLYNTSVEQLKANIATVYNAEAELAAQPYTAKPALLPASIDPYTLLFASPAPLERFLWTQRKTERLLDIIALQQRADRLEKKQRTGSLPADPFGSGPLKEKNGTIYSVGPDTKDDGCKPVPIPGRAQMSDIGDIPAPTF